MDPTEVWVREADGNVLKPHSSWEVQNETKRCFERVFMELTTKRTFRCTMALSAEITWSATARLLEPFEI